jgi:hypothetical protein
MFKETGHQNAYFPYLFLKACLKEKNAEGFAKRVRIDTLQIKNDPDKPVS